MVILMLELDLMRKEMEMLNSGGTQKEIIKFLTLITTTMLSSMVAMTGSSVTLEKSGFFLELQDLLKATLIMLSLWLKRKLVKTPESPIITISTDGSKPNKEAGANTTLIIQALKLNCSTQKVEWETILIYEYYIVSTKNL